MFMIYGPYSGEDRIYCYVSSLEKAADLCGQIYDAILKEKDPQYHWMFKSDTSREENISRWMEKNVYPIKVDVLEMY